MASAKSAGEIGCEAGETWNASAGRFGLSVGCQFIVFCGGPAGFVVVLKKRVCDASTVFPTKDL